MTPKIRLLPGVTDKCVTKLAYFVVMIIPRGNTVSSSRRRYIINNSSYHCQTARHIIDSTFLTIQPKGLQRGLASIALMRVLHHGVGSLPCSAVQGGEHGALMNNGVIQKIQN